MLSQSIRNGDPKMTYSELSQAKTAGFNTNHIIDDVVNNARWAFGKKAFGNKLVTDHEAKQINEWANSEGVQSPFAPMLVIPTQIEHANGKRAQWI
jgi:hypothetical protein